MCVCVHDREKEKKKEDDVDDEWLWLEVLLQIREVAVMKHFTSNFKQRFESRLLFIQHKYGASFSLLQHKKPHSWEKTAGLTVVQMTIIVNLHKEAKAQNIMHKQQEGPQP